MCCEYILLTTKSCRSFDDMHLIHIRILSCNMSMYTCMYPRITHFCIAKLGYTGVHLFFSFFLQNIDCGCSLEPPRRGGSNVYPQSMFRANTRKKYIKKLSAEKFQFLQLKNLCIMHGRVFVMASSVTTESFSLITPWSKYIVAHQCNKMSSVFSLHKYLG